ncbi:ABC transporter ATP-binding protein [Pseudoalteromonas denitrificans]|uniref:Putative ABC transport system ATP-binding protein n=1 Tax=Pseudoalteromonas denitrificans DSM 6059 TaxID=1123010 RepID=A0A1I1P5J7_9GAMM|nr:ATP-binding cassette domain-containing protein [Pseudoalteromonas denitrificans]SFD05077.1 putative ABC transport system ATP-binding protein [Pseudoalteromonas denitrificans DSM 6059]
MSLVIKDLHHKIIDGAHSKKLLSGLDLKLNPSTTVALMGDSGSGKTTLLNLISGLEPIQQGEINISGQALQNLTETQLSQIRKNDLGIIFQQFNLLSSLNVQDNIEFSAKLSNRFDRLHCQMLIQNLGLESLLSNLPATLSGGEVQRVAIARALAAKPQILLADEPTGNLDNSNSERVVRLLAQLAKAHQTELLMVTHSLYIAQEMDEIYQLNNGRLTCIKGSKHV